MIGISHVELERRSKDPDGKVVYSVYALHTSGAMTPWEIHNVGTVIPQILQSATHKDPKLAQSVKEPIACYVADVIHIKLILFGEFDAKEIMYAIASGRKNLNR